jgi:hypothetical protein
MSTPTAIFVLIVTVVIGLAVLVLVARDRLQPPKPIETSADRTAQERRLMKLWAFAALLLLVASWLVRRLR